MKETLVIFFLWPTPADSSLKDIYCLCCPVKRNTTAAFCPHYSTSFKQELFPVDPPTRRSDWRAPSLTENSNFGSISRPTQHQTCYLDCECACVDACGRQGKRSLTSIKERPPANDRRGILRTPGRFRGLLILARGGGSRRLRRCVIAAVIGWWEERSLLQL